MKTLLFASKHDFLPHTKGGGELCVAELLHKIASQAMIHNIVLAASDRLSHSEIYTWQGIEVRRVPVANFSASLLATVEKVAPIAILTYLEGTGLVADIGYERNIPTGLFIVDRGGVFDGLSCFARKPAVIIALSRYLATLSQQHFHCESLLFPPVSQSTPSVSHPTAKERFDLQSVGMLNLNRMKGAHLFHSLVRKCPQFRFVAVKGWSYTEIAPFVEGSASNLKILDWSDNVDTFYERVSVLLAPSLCPEGFGRAVREAIQRGIPVIASDRGALRESTCEVADFLDPTKADVWRKALTYLLGSEEVYMERSNAGKRAAQMQLQHDSIQVQNTVFSTIKMLRLVE